MIRHKILIVIVFIAIQTKLILTTFAPETISKQPIEYKYESDYQTNRQFNHFFNQKKISIEPKHIASEEQNKKTNTKQPSHEEKNKDTKTTNPFIENQNDITLKESNELQQDEKQTNSESDKNKNINNFFTPFKQQPSLNIHSIIDTSHEVFDKFDKCIHKITFFIIKKSIKIPLNNHTFDTTFSDIISQTIKRYLFQLLQLPKKSNVMPTNTINAMNNFKLEIQFLAQQIKNFNGKMFYTNPEQMLMLIKIINNFLKEAASKNITFEISKKIDKLYQQAKKCYNIFINQNIIFSTEDTPQEILQYFDQSIKNTDNLTSIQYSYNLIQKIYESNGYIDQILQSWQNFEKSNLYKNKINRQYGAFITFLLLFQNSIAAGANILDQTSGLYKVTNPINITINI